MSTRELLGDVAEEGSDEDEEFNGEGSPPASPEGEGDDLADSSGACPQPLVFRQPQAHKM